MKINLGVKPYLFPMPVLMIATYGEDDRVNVMNMAWGGICDDNKVALNISDTHKTADNLRARRAFTISVANQDHLEAADYFGMVTGNKVPDKFERTGLHAVRSERVDAPVVTEFPLTIECRVVDMKTTDGTMRVVGEIVNVLADETVLGNSQPLFTYGFNTTLTWGRVDLFLALAGSYGNKLFNGLATRLTKGSTYYNSLAIVADRWTETNPSDRIQRASDDLTIVSDSRYVEDASYLRLKNVQVGYTLPLRQVTKDAQIRLFLSLQNFVTLTRYSGYDPEASRNGMDEHSALYQGVDMGTYPTAKTVQVGLQLTL